MNQQVPSQQAVVRQSVQPVDLERLLEKRFTYRRGFDGPLIPAVLRLGGNRDLRRYIAVSADGEHLFYCHEIIQVDDDIITLEAA